jgi:hypothetical protein
MARCGFANDGCFFFFIAHETSSLKSQPTKNFFLNSVHNCALLVAAHLANINKGQRKLTLS